MQKTVCNLCGDDCDKSPYRIPAYRTTYGTGKGGAKMMAFEEVVPEDMDLCPFCASVVAGDINLLKASVKQAKDAYAAVAKET